MSGDGLVVFVALIPVESLSGDGLVVFIASISVEGLPGDGFGRIHCLDVKRSFVW